MVRRIVLLTCVVAGVSVAPASVVCAQTSSPPPTAGPPALTLQDVVTAAVKQSPLVEAARGRLSAAQGSGQTAGLPPNPMATWWRDDAIAVYATMPIEPFVQRGARVGQADASLRAAQSDLQNAAQDAAMQAAQAFYRVALAQSALDAAKEDRDGLQQVVDYLQIRIAQGASAEGDGIRAQVERDRADLDVTLAEVELVRAQAALRPWLGETTGPVTAIRVTLPSAGGTSAMPAFSELSTHALATRPDILSSRARRDAALDAITLERRRAIGQFGASFGFKRMEDDSNRLVAGATFTVPLFDRNRGEIRRATGEQLAADAETRWLERTVTSDLEGAYEAATRLAAQVAALQPAFVQRAQESRDIAVGALREGAATLLQVIDATHALTDARLTYTRAQVTASQSLFELRVMAGYDATTAASQGGTR